MFYSLHTIWLQQLRKLTICEWTGAIKRAIHRFLSQQLVHLMRITHSSIFSEEFSSVTLEDPHTLVAWNLYGTFLQVVCHFQFSLRILWHPDKSSVWIMFLVDGCSSGNINLNYTGMSLISLIYFQLITARRRNSSEKTCVPKVINQSILILWS